jgi:mono/diheme cytochrome c family protein
MIAHCNRGRPTGDQGRGRHSTWVRVMSASGRRLPSLIIIIAALTSGPVRAENLDEGKSGATLFTATCASCHRSARGLTKNRLSWTLSYFLQQHYTSSATSAQVLTAYLQSVDAPRGKTQPQAPVRSAAAPLLRPPAPMSAR